MIQPLRQGYTDNLIICEDIPIYKYILNHVKYFIPDDFSNIRESDRIIYIFSNGEFNIISDIEKRNAKPSVIVTSRNLPQQPLSIKQNSNTIILPWCEDVMFVEWILILLDFRGRKIFPHWFFRHGIDKNIKIKGKSIHLVFEELSDYNPFMVSVATLADMFGCSSWHLINKLRSEIGVSPGKLLQAWRLFWMTTNLMAQEKERNSRLVNLSPLSEIENDYRRSLKRLLGITYSELKEISKQKDWRVIWMERFHSTF